MSQLSNYYRKLKKDTLKGLSCGTPETLAANPASYTGRYLARLLHKTN